MLNTFENAERQHLRRLERERHLNILDSITNNDCTFQLPFESEDKPYAVDALAGVPLAKSLSEDHGLTESQNRSRWWRSNRLALLAGAAVVLGILLGFSLGVDVGEQDVGSRDKEVVDDSMEQPNKGLQRYNQFFSQILDWGITPRDILEDVSSAPARALHWLAYEDTMTNNDEIDSMRVETVRTRFVLATFYFSTQNISVFGESTPLSEKSWAEKSNWLSAYPVCRWFGVECLEDEFGRSTLGLIKSMNLSMNGLVGQLPNELGLLQLDIRSFDVSGNAIGGTIPETLSALKNLNDLYLGPNAFTSTLPETIFELPHLTHIYVNDCNLTGTISPKVGTLKQLQGLGLHNNNFSGEIPTQIGDMQSIQALYLDGNALTGTIPSTIGQLTGLVDLRLRQNKLNGTLPLELQKLKDLEFLYLDSNNFTGEVPGPILGSFRFMRDLQLYNNQLEGRIPSEIGSLIFLRTLYLDGNHLTAHLPTELGLLTSLESLFVFGNKLEGFIPNELGQMTNLKKMELNNNLLSGPIPDLSGLQLETLFLNNNTLGGQIPSSLEKLTDIQSIHMHGNRFTGYMPPALCSLSKIKELTSDCAGTDPEVNCGCCTSCYQD